MSSALMQVYNRFAINFTHGKGLSLYDSEGKAYLDAGSGIAVNAFGHCHPKLVAALQKQSETLWHISNLYTSDVQLEFAKLLCDATFADNVFFTNSGAEAIECALKTARRYFHKQGTPQRRRIITFKGAFHGRTQLCISAAGAKTEDGFGTVSPDFDIIPFGDHAALKAAITDETAAILMEPIQGEGGIRLVPIDCLKAIRQLCDEHGILLIFDEIQSGMGRTGKLFAFEHAEIAPDICTSAKGIAGGFPLGACLATDKAAAGMTYGTHGSTYGGNPLGCAVGHAAVEMILEDGFLSHVTQIGVYLKDKLLHLQEKYPDYMTDVRGIGLLLGIKLHDDYKVRDVAEKLLYEGLITIPASDNVMRIVPPLIITQNECDHLCDILDGFFAKETPK
ncbi:MAG: aspartate aminotransferase family protein [Pseudomonadota bacterium]